MYMYRVNVIVLDIEPYVRERRDFSNLNDAKQYMQDKNNIQSKEIIVCNQYSGSPIIDSNFIKIKCIKTNGKLLIYNNDV